MSIPASPQVLLMVDVASAGGGTIASANPPMNTYVLDIPQGGNAPAIARTFAADQNFPVNTVAYFVDLSAPDASGNFAIRKFTLQANWVED